MFAARPGPPIATHHLDLSGLPLNEALTILDRRQSDPYHPERTFKISLLAGGDEVEELVDWLDDGAKKIVHQPWVRSALLDRIRTRSSTSNGTASTRPECSAAGPSIQTSRIPLRVIVLSNHKLTQKGYDAFARLIAMHGSLTVLDLTLNTLYKQPLPSLRSLSFGVSQSLLRKLVLSDTRLTVDAFCELIDNLDAPCLHELRLSLTLPARETISRQESQRAALSVARLLRVPDRDSRPSRPMSRQRGAHTEADTELEQAVGERETGGRAPQLEVVTLNGNPLTLPGVKMIVAAAVGGPASTPNRVLTHVELFYTCESDERDEDDNRGREGGEASGRGGAECSNDARRTLSISRGYRAAKQAALHDSNNGMAHSAAGELLGPPRRSESSDCGAEQWRKVRGYPSQTWYEPDDPRAYAHVTAENWRRLLGAHLWHNTRQRSSVVYAAQTLLGKARVLGCKSSFGNTLAQSSEFVAHVDIASASPSPFLSASTSLHSTPAPPMALERLPPELRLAILREVDGERILSEEQFRRVVTWACDSSTIGYGAPGVPPPWDRRGADWAEGEDPWAEEGQANPDQPILSSAAPPMTGLLPCAPWSWRDMLHRSLPRDWTAESWDLWNEHKDTIPIVGGGGGPDGQGGATEPIHRGGGGGRGGGSGAVVAKLDHRAPDPALLAFLEATGTRAWQD